MEPESSNCSASVSVDVPNPMDVRASKMGKQCFLVYKLDLPTGALSNPRLTHALLYMPYNEVVHMIPKTLLVDLDCGSDWTHWTHNPKFVINPECNTVMLLHPDNKFSHIALPGSQQSDEKDHCDNLGRPLPIPIKRRPTGPGAKWRNMCFRNLDIYLLMVGSWCMLNQSNEAKLKICPVSRTVVYEIITRVASTDPSPNDPDSEEEMQKTIVVVEINFADIVSFTIMDKWQLAIRVKKVPKLIEYLVRFRLKTLFGTKKYSAYSTTARSLNFVDPDSFETKEFADGQFKTNLLHRIMVSKNNVSRVVDFMIDLQSPDLYNCQYLEQPIACPADGSTATPAEAKGGKTDARERDFQNSQGSSSSLQQHRLDANSSSDIEVEDVSLHSFDPHKHIKIDAGVNLPDDVDYNNEEQQSQLDDNPETHQTSSMNQYYNPMSGAVDDSSPPESNTATSTATCTCANGLCMDSAICPCLARASTCAAECKCMDCENPLNVLRVVHQVPLERVLADICLLQNLVANPRVQIARISTGSTYRLPCCQTPVATQDILQSAVITCAQCTNGDEEVQYHFSWCFDMLVHHATTVHCSPCNTCRSSSYIHCEKCNFCFDSGENGANSCINCLRQPQSFPQPLAADNNKGATELFAHTNLEQQSYAEGINMAVIQDRSGDEDDCSDEEQERLDVINQQIQPHQMNPGYM